MPTSPCHKTRVWVIVCAFPWASASCFWCTITQEWACEDTYVLPVCTYVLLFILITTQTHIRVFVRVFDWYFYILGYSKGHTIICTGVQRFCCPSYTYHPPGFITQHSISTPQNRPHPFWLTHIHFQPTYTHFWTTCTHFEPLTSVFDPPASVLTLWPMSTPFYQPHPISVPQHPPPMKCTYK